jgi:uncharacterized protein (TIGR00159 family)
VLLFDIGFLTIRWVDVFDILLATALLYGIYKIVKGSLAVNIFIGFIMIYFCYFVFLTLDMKLMSNILGQFISVGSIVLIVVFQQEIRRFLLMIGKNHLLFKVGSGFKFANLLPWNWNTVTPEEINFEEIAIACKKFSKNSTGALIIIARTSDLRFFLSTGVPVEGEVSSQLLETIFQKKSPLHDGAVIIMKDKIKAASCILPVSERPDLPQEFGLRHRSAIGITEQTDALAIIVSEETGKISYSNHGEMVRNVPKEELAMSFFRAYHGIEEE